MKRKVSIGLSMLLIVLLSGGCQSSSLTVPELISERESSKKTCVAEYHDIYDVKVEDAWVNGVRECVIAKTDGVVKELHKIVGDRVKKGDVLLTTASEELETRYESLQEEISEIDQNHASQLKVYQLERQKRTAITAMMPLPPAATSTNLPPMSLLPNIWKKTTNANVWPRCLCS